MLCKRAGQQSGYQRQHCKEADDPYKNTVLAFDRLYLHDITIRTGLWV